MAASGDLGEALAALHLVRRGWRILHRNWRGGGGELDIVAIRRGLVAFVEVKARGDPAELDEPVRHAQRERLVRAATAYLARHPGLWGVETRFDVITVEMVRPGRRRRVTHIRDAFHVPDATVPSCSKSRSSVYAADRNDLR